MKDIVEQMKFIETLMQSDEELLLPKDETLMDQQICNSCACAPCCCAELGITDLQQEEITTTQVDSDDYFPSGEHGTAADKVGPTAARNGNNPMSTACLSEDDVDVIEEILSKEYAMFKQGNFDNYERYDKQRDERDFENRLKKEAGIEGPEMEQPMFSDEKSPDDIEQDEQKRNEFKKTLNIIKSRLR